MTDPIRWQSKVILVKTEVTYGVDPTPSGAANAILMTNGTIVPMEGQNLSRNLDLPYLAAQGNIPVGLRMRLRGSVELQSSGEAGVAPGWSPLLRACAVAETIVSETSVTYNPISAAMESATCWFWIGSTKHILKGLRGTATFRLNALGIPVIEFDMTGIYAQPAEAAAATPTLSGFLEPLPVSNVNTTTFEINSVPLVMSAFSHALGNQVTYRNRVGFEGVIIPSRADALTIQCEAVPLTTLNPMALATSPKTQFAVDLVHGTEEGAIFTFSYPTAELDPPGYRNDEGQLGWDLSVTPLADSGNDQWTLAIT